MTKIDAVLDQEIQPLIRAEMVKAAGDAASSTDAAALLLLVMGGVAVTVATAAALNIWRGIIEPVHELVWGAEIIGGGALDHRIEVNTKDELGQLAAAFNRMVERLGNSQQLLRDNEQRIRLITDAVPGLIAYVDADQRYRFVNRKYEDVYAVPRQDIIGKHVKEVWGETTYREAESHLEAVLSGREVSFEAVRRFKNGETRHYQSYLVPHFDDDGKVQGYFTLGMDITARKRSEEEIKKLNEELEGSPARSRVRSVVLNFRR